MTEASEQSTIYKKLYKKNDSGSINLWEIHHNMSMTTYWTVSGKFGGKMTQSGHQIITRKANRSQVEQAILEMDAKVLQKIRKKYVENLEDIDKAEVSLPGYSAMLAKKFADEKDKLSYPVICQPKFDGVRCLALKQGLFSRGRKRHESCQHVWDVLAPFFKKYPESRLDGELYAHEFKNDFETIIKAVRKSAKHATDEDRKLQSRIQYHVYDAPVIPVYPSLRNSEGEIVYLREEESFDKRRQALQCWLTELNPSSTALRAVSQYEAHTEDELNEIHCRFIEEGYEGTMIRQRHMPYEGKRTKNLLKKKDFLEEEFIIKGVQEGTGKLVGHAATLHFENEDGNKFEAKPEGSFGRLKWIFENPSAVIGRAATIRYQERTGKGNVPRFGVVKDIRGLPDGSDWI